MPIWISDDVRKKLADKHRVTEEEVRQCFANLEGVFLKDTREEHRTDPPTHWFVSETDRRRVLKVCFIARKSGVGIRTEIKSAYPPDATELAIWERHGQC